MSFIIIRGLGGSLLNTYGYGVPGVEAPDPSVTERSPEGIQIPAPQHVFPEVEYTYEMLTRGHRDKEYTIVSNGYKELQKRYRQEHFNILDSYQNVFKGFHEPGAQFKFSDLLAYYPFDGDTDAECLQDRSGRGLDLVLDGSPIPTFVDGQSNQAIAFPIEGGGKAYYAGCLFPSIETGFSSLSISFWLNILPLVDGEGDITARDHNTLLFRYYTDTYFFDVHLSTDDRIRVSMYDADNKSLIWFSERPILDASVFQHITLTYRKTYLDSSLALGIPVIKLYVNKEQKLMSLYTSDTDAPRELTYDALGTTILGQDSGCLLDEFRVYGHDLDQSEITTDFNYKAVKLDYDCFDREEFASPLWTISEAVG